MGPSNHMKLYCHRVTNNLSLVLNSRLPEFKALSRIVLVIWVEVRVAIVVMEFSNMNASKTICVFLMVMLFDTM
jgi:hypothetical protein